jgi:Na+/H+-translocating membrane pyrophosphatase
VVWTAAEIVSLISALLTFILGVVGAILAYLKSKNDAKYGAINAEAVKSATPSPEDYNGLNISGGTGLSKGSSWLPFAAIAAGLLLLIKK